MLRRCATPIFASLSLLGCGASDEVTAAPTTTLHASVGPIALSPGQESVQCVVVNLNNPESASIRAFRTTLGAGSHHMIVYRSIAPKEDLSPTPCVSFGGVLGGEAPIFIAETPTSELEFPTDAGKPVGLPIAAHQLVRVEIHMINTTSAPLDVRGDIAIDAVPQSADLIPSDLAFWGTTDINIPPNATATTGLKFQAALPNTKSFALTTHQHHYGTRMRAWYSEGPDDSAPPVIDATDWSTPPLITFNPPLTFPESRSSNLSNRGFTFTCDWKNPTAKQVPFGESANDEMCFLWHYYYPSQGFSVCVDGHCK